MEIINIFTNVFVKRSSSLIHNKVLQSNLDLNAEKAINKKRYRSKQKNISRYRAFAKSKSHPNVALNFCVFELKTKILINARLSLP